MRASGGARRSVTQPRADIACPPRPSACAVQTCQAASRGNNRDESGAMHLICDSFFSLSLSSSFAALPRFISFQCIYGCYVHSAILPTFHRRCYWLLQVRTAVAGAGAKRLSSGIICPAGVTFYGNKIRFNLTTKAFLPFSITLTYMIRFRSRARRTPTSCSFTTSTCPTPTTTSS